MSIIETTEKLLKVDDVDKLQVKPKSSEEVMDLLISKMEIFDNNVKVLIDHYKNIEREFINNPLGHTAVLVGKQITESLVNLPYIVKFLLMSHKSMEKRIFIVESLCEHLLEENTNLKIRINS